MVFRTWVVWLFRIVDGGSDYFHSGDDKKIPRGSAVLRLSADTLFIVVLFRAVSECGGMVAESLRGDTALYLRLSREDGAAGESESIASQRAMLQQYAAANGFSVYRIYADDGISGTEWERPAFQEMLYAVRQGLIRNIITKDLSRLSRDYIRTGELLERWFPAHGVRYIAVTDGVDTGKSLAANDFMPFRAVMNDWYARDISCKVRAALHARQENGVCTLATIPFGYTRHGDSIKPIAALVPIVRDIFLRGAAGESYRSIAKHLTEQHIPTPRMPPGDHGARGRWNDVTIRRMLENPVYMGKLALHRTERVNYKCKEKRALPPAQWHWQDVPPIIEAELFTAVQERLRGSKRRPTQRHWLSGLAYCGECGAAMTLREGNTAAARLQCSGRRQGNGCTNPTMRTAEAEALLGEQFAADGLPLQPALWQQLITEIRITRSIFEVSVLYRPPRSGNSP